MVEGLHGVLPTMAKLAQKYLSVCASSSPSERIFSCSGNIVSKKRTLETREGKHVGFFEQKPSLDVDYTYLSST